MTPSATVRAIESDEDVERARQEFANCLATGLARDNKCIPSRFLYDARGCELFEDITRLPEYYPTRTERKILEAYGSEIAQQTPAGAALVEFGSGSSLKTEILLRKLDKLAAYVAIDISSDALINATHRLAKAFPHLIVHPVVANIQEPVALPRDVESCHKLGFFPGSTIGNFVPLHAISLLKHMSQTLGKNSRLIIGVDLKKDRETLLRAYNDGAGVTAAFNLNLLARANRELGANFDVGAFEHEAVYDEKNGRIEMYLVSRASQSVEFGGKTYRFAKGEHIHTEHSHKYDIKEFADLALQAGWTSRTVWTDDNKLFSVHELVN